jgi:hypothetical protein
VTLPPISSATFQRFGMVVTTFSAITSGIAILERNSITRKTTIFFIRSCGYTKGINVSDFVSTHNAFDDEFFVCDCSLSGNGKCPKKNDFCS